MNAVAQALETAFARFGNRLRTEHDPEWCSPCEELPPDREGNIRWKPVSIEPPFSFDLIEDKTGICLHEDIKAWYGTYFAGTLGVQHPRAGNLDLDFAWNHEDLRRLSASIVEHIVSHRDECGFDSVFIGGTGTDVYLSVDNASGAVLLEEPGQEAPTVIAQSVCAFISELQ